MTDSKEKFTVKSIDPELLAKAKKIAIDERRPLSDVIKELLETWVSDKEKEEKLKKP
jgi:hypothetical protein